jgi:uncharacterized protein YecE (DUF72 family)
MDADAQHIRLARLFVGTAGWAVPKEHGALFPGNGPHLERYGGVFRCAEINTSFYRPHRRSTYMRWAEAVPERFRFAAKIPKTITHERRLRDALEPLERFLSEVEGLGPKRGPLLLQMPPSLAFEPAVAEPFLRDLRERADGAVVCEPRHASWFAPAVDDMLAALRIARVAADPAPVPGAGEPGGWRGLTYIRLHGSPRIYYSPYSQEALGGVARRIDSDLAANREVWCILDNTAAFAAARDALTLRDLVAAPDGPP